MKLFEELVVEHRNIIKTVKQEYNIEFVVTKYYTICGIPYTKTIKKRDEILFKTKDLAEEYAKLAKRVSTNEYTYDWVHAIFVKNIKYPIYWNEILERYTSSINDREIKSYTLTEHIEKINNYIVPKEEYIETIYPTNIDGVHLSSSIIDSYDKTKEKRNELIDMEIKRSKEMIAFLETLKR